MYTHTNQIGIVMLMIFMMAYLHSSKWTEEKENTKQIHLGLCFWFLAFKSWSLIEIANQDECTRCIRLFFLAPNLYIPFIILFVVFVFTLNVLMLRDGYFSSVCRVFALNCYCSNKLNAQLSFIKSSRAEIWPRTNTHTHWIRDDRISIIFQMLTA